MKISVAQSDLRKALSLISHAVPSKSSLPIIQNVLISTDRNSMVRLTGTNLEIAMTCWISATIIEEGAITLPGKMLNDLITNLPNDIVKIDVDMTTASITCAKFKTTLSGMIADDYPAIPSVESTAAATFDRETLITVLSRVCVAAATDDSRPILTATRLTMNGVNAELCAADGFRLTNNQFEALSNSSDTQVQMLIPARTMIELVRLLAADKEAKTVTMTATNNAAVFRTASFELVTRLIDGKYPDITRVIPTEFKGRTIVETVALIRAVKLAALMGNSSVRMTFDEGGVYVTSGGSERGIGEGTVEASHFGEKTNIALNVNYLQEALDTMSRSGMSISINTISPQSPAVMRIVGNETFVHVIMPMNIA